MQVNLKVASDVGSVRSVLRSVQASGQLLSDVQMDLAGFPVSAIVDPGDGSSSP